MSILPHENVLQLQIQTPDIPNADYFVRVPDDQYVAEFIGAEGFLYRGRGPRVALWFVIVEGSQSGVRVPAYCNVRSLDERCSGRVRQPQFTAGGDSNLVMFLGILFPERYTPDDLPTEIPENDMLGRPILIQTRTVSKNHDRCERPAAFHKSVVKFVLGWAE